MKAKKLLAGILSAAMVIGTMALPSFADEETNVCAAGAEKPDETLADVLDIENTPAPSSTSAAAVAMVGEVGYPTVDEAINAAQAQTTDKWSIAKITLLTNDALDISKGPNNYVSYNITKNDTVITGERIADDAHKEYYKLTNASTLYIPADVNSLILENVKNLCRIELAKGADVTLKLNGDNEIAGNIFVPAGAKLTIEDITVDSTGRLAVYNTADKQYLPRMNAFGAGDGYSAAIGGSQSKPGGEILIKSGAVEAYSNYGSAIGGGQQGSGNVTIFGGKVKAEASYGCAIGGGQQSTGNVTISGGVVDAHSDRSTVIGGSQETGSNVVITGGEIKATSDFNKDNLFGNKGNEKGNGAEITGGSFDSAIGIKDYIPKGQMAVENEDGTHNVQKAAARVNDTVSFGGMIIKMVRLDRNEAVDLKKDSNVKIDAKNPSAEDVAAVNAKIASEADTNTAKQIFNITPVQEGNSINVQNQVVEITLTENIASGSEIYVYHVKGATTEKIRSTTEGNTVTFTAPSFSTYAVMYTPVAAAENDITTKVGVVFSPVDGTNNEYYINLKALDDGKIINRFMAADLVFTNGVSTIDYEIEPALNMTADLISTGGNSREYRFNMNGTAASGATGSGITIGTIKFLGYGTLNFKVDNTYVSAATHVNVIQTAKADDNIVDTYSGTSLIINTDATNANYPTTIAADESGTITGEIAVEKKNLAINIAFNNNAENQVKLYQDMKVVISGGDLENDIVYELGSDNTEVKYNTNASGVRYYNVTIADTLAKNTAYTVTVEGAGYRTARYTVTMTADKTLNFWNNVKSAAAYIEEGVGTAKTSNFLAGDIVKDGKINVYDLSAVVSYFGTTNATGAVSPNAKYDLNRDGAIDSKDVAYVLVSWGE